MLRRLAFIAASALPVIAIPGVAAAADGPLGAGTARWLATAGAFGAVLMLGFVFSGPRRDIERDLQRRLGSYAPQAVGSNWLTRLPLFRWFTAGAEEAARRRGMLTGINSILEQANLPLRAGEAVVGALAGSVLVGIVGGLWGRSLTLGVAVAVGTVAAAAYGVQGAAKREKTRFENQLPDTLNLMATSLRAGYSLLQTLESVAGEAAEPTAREFSRALSEVRLGQQIGAALTGVADRMGSLDFEYAVMAIEIQREVGGNLAEVLTSSADTMLQRNRLRRDTKALTAEGRLSAIILSVIPVLLFAFLFFTNRDYLDPLLDTTVGRIGLAGSALLLLAGIYWLRRIVDVEV